TSHRCFIARWRRDSRTSRDAGRPGRDDLSAPRRTAEHDLPGSSRPTTLHPGGRRADQGVALTGTSRTAIQYATQEEALRACLKIAWSPVFGEKAAWRGATREHTRSGL